MQLMRRASTHGAAFGILHVLGPDLSGVARESLQLSQSRILHDGHLVAQPVLSLHCVPQLNPRVIPKQFMTQSPIPSSRLCRAFCLSRTFHRNKLICSCLELQGFYGALKGNGTLCGVA